MDITCSLTPVPLSAEENKALKDLFYEEKHFKLKFDLPQKNQDEIEVTLEGSFIKENFVTQLVG